MARSESDHRACSDGFAAISIVLDRADGSKRTYPDAAGYVDYDGYLGIYSSDGTRLAMRNVRLGRGDVLAALRLTQGSFVAVGSSGWDRWQGGMSISREADPLVAWMSSDASKVVTQTVALIDGSRHFGRHYVATLVSDHWTQSGEFATTRPVKGTHGNASFPTQQPPSLRQYARLANPFECQWTASPLTPCFCV